MVGERGFEPPTPWSRTRCSTRLSHSPTVLEGDERKTAPGAAIRDFVCTEIITKPSASSPRRCGPNRRRRGRYEYLAIAAKIHFSADRKKDLASVNGPSRHRRTSFGIRYQLHIRTLRIHHEYLVIRPAIRGECDPPPVWRPRRPTIECGMMAQVHFFVAVLYKDLRIHLPDHATKGDFLAIG